MIRECGDKMGEVKGWSLGAWVRRGGGAWAGLYAIKPGWWAGLGWWSYLFLDLLRCEIVRCYDLHLAAKTV